MGASLHCVAPTALIEDAVLMPFTVPAEPPELAEPPPLPPQATKPSKHTKPKNTFFIAAPAWKNQIRKFNS